MTVGDIQSLVHMLPIANEAHPQTVPGTKPSLHVEEAKPQFDQREAKDALIIPEGKFNLIVWLTDWLNESNSQLVWEGKKQNNLMHLTTEKTFSYLIMFPIPCVSARVASTCWRCWTSMRQGRQSCLPCWSRLSECHGFMVRDSRDSLVFLPVFYPSLAAAVRLNSVVMNPNPTSEGLQSIPPVSPLLWTNQHMVKFKSYWLSQSQRIWN